MEPVLGRRVLNHAVAHRGQLDMTSWGHTCTECGTIACLAGWTLLLSDYSIAGDDSFYRPDGSRVAAVDIEARNLLRVAGSEYRPEGGLSLFDIQDEDEAIERFRALVEAAEAAARQEGEN